MLYGNKLNYIIAYCFLVSGKYIMFKIGVYNYFSLLLIHSDEIFIHFIWLVGHLLQFVVGVRLSVKVKQPLDLHVRL